MFALGDDDDSPVREVARAADETEFERSGASPPAETDSLHATLHPCREPHRLVALGDHGLLAYLFVPPNRSNAGAQMLALATGVVLVAGVAVATFPDELVPTALRTDDAIAAATGADVVPRAAHVDDRPPPSEISTVHAYAAIPGVTSGGPEKPPEPPPPPPAPAAPKREPVSVGGAVGEVIALTNERRREAGCGALAPDGRLTRAAQAHASDMHEKGYFDHVSRDGRRFEHRVRAAGYPRPGAENIAKGQTSARQVVREWMASPSHRSAMLTCAFTTIGVARSGNYWVQEFGK
ncbi:hypothetical protein GCM10009559_72520 [Pseudonocardia zijingensis]|jgi:uncharacterized protein YkwD|uniref:SCP domain-containing protein n=2 Tax=Pseudonocardia zijingensis TaxID=153376 RepID=A0ABP3YW01_9PSEU